MTGKPATPSSNSNTALDNCEEPEQLHNKRKEKFEEVFDPSIKKSKPDSLSGSVENRKESSCSKDENNKKGDSQKSFVIEAGAAEDKGSRHTMEDALVMLPDASSDSHATLSWMSKLQKRPFLMVFVGLMNLFCKKVLLVFVANIGDAKAVVARSASSDGLNNSNDLSPLKAIVLTREHKAIYPQERARIQKAGGSVSSNGRIQGRLEVSRAFGDRQFKKVGVTAVPDIQTFDLTEKEHFIILGCDGLWGVLGPSDAVVFVHKLLKDGLPVTTVCRRLVKEAVLERGCKDNCTAIIIVFRHE